MTVADCTQQLYDTSRYTYYNTCHSTDGITEGMTILRVLFVHKLYKIFVINT